MIPSHISKENRRYRPYLRTPDPFNRESGLGWLLRCSEANSITLNRVLRKVYGSPFSPRLINSLMLEHFAEVFNKSPEALSHLTYYSRGYHATFRSHKIEKNDILVGCAQVCPRCIKELGYIDALWDLFRTVACDRHGVYLTYRCQSCSKMLSYNRKAMLTCHCGAEIQCEGLVASPEVIELQADYRAVAFGDPLPSSEVGTYENVHEGGLKDFFGNVRNRHGLSRSDLRKFIEDAANYFFRQRNPYSRLNRNTRELEIPFQYSGPVIKAGDTEFELISFDDARRMTHLSLATLGNLCRAGFLKRIKAEQSWEYLLRLKEVASLIKRVDISVSKGRPTVPLTAVLFWQNEALEWLVISEILSGRIRTYSRDLEWSELELDLEDLELRAPNYIPPSGTRIYSKDIQQKTGISEIALDALAARGHIQRFDTLTRNFYQRESIVAFLDKYVVVDWFSHRNACLKVLAHFKSQSRRLCLPNT